VTPGTLSDGDGDVVYGLLTLAGMDVALPLSALREVVPRPAELTGLPVTAPGLLGAMSLRALVLPVVDLRPLMGRPAERAADQVVVVVASGGQLLGLVADSVRGVTRLPADALLAMSVADGQLLFSHTFRHLVTDTPVSVLDAAALLRLPGVPTVADIAYAQATSGAGATAARLRGTGRSLTVVRSGAHVLGFDVTEVHTTLPLIEIRSSILSGGLCLGVTDQAGHEVPVVDSMALLGLPPLAEDDIGAGLVLDFGHGLVILAVSELLELRETPHEDVLPVPRHAVDRPELLAGMADLETHGACLVIDGPALMAEPELLSLSSVNTALSAGAPAAEAAGSGGAAAAPGRGPAYISYSVGVDVATPLVQVAEILSHPETMTTTTSEDAVLGMIVHRRSAVPVLCLSQVLGRGPVERTSTSCLLLVDVDGEQIAFAVQTLRGIDPLTWSDADQVRGRPIPVLTRALNTSPLVQVGSESRLVPDLDLFEVARAVRGYGADAVPRFDEAALEAELSRI